MYYFVFFFFPARRWPRYYYGRSDSHQKRWLFVPCLWYYIFRVLNLTQKRENTWGTFAIIHSNINKCRAGNLPQGLCIFTPILNCNNNCLYSGMSGLKYSKGGVLYCTYTIYTDNPPKHGVHFSKLNLIHCLFCWERWLNGCPVGKNWSLSQKSDRLLKR